MDRDEKSMLAGEFTLGLLEGEERRRAEAQIATDVEFRRELGFWQDSLATMLLGRQVEPSAAVYAGIRQRLFDRPEEAWIGRLLRPENRPQLVVVLAAKAFLLALVVLLLL